MRSAALYLKDPNASRFLGGGLPEAELLLGSPLPPLPPTERENGREVFHVRFHPHVRTLLSRFLAGLLREIGAEPGAAARKQDTAREQAEYEAMLAKVLRSVRCNDRRMGLASLFWLAHSREVAESLRELEARTPAIKKLKYSLHPLLSSFYRRLEDGARRARERGDAAAALAADEGGTGLVDSIIDDGFAFTELSIGDVDFNQYLAHNKRYRLSSDLFFEMYTILVRETERRLREGERGLLSRVQRHLPGLSREQCQTQGGVVKVMMNTHVLAYLLGDAWSVGTRMTASPRLRAETERRRPAEIVDVFLDLLAGVKRFEIISHIRDRVRLLRPFADDNELDERGLRLYEFGESAQVINNAVNATVFFLDLRGFTKTSEGQISERDLTRELYTVFDAFVPHIRRFGGAIDKFLGDGIMVTYGTEHGDPLNPLNALRAAILCQETLRRLRESGQTYFKMGIAVHFGRVHLARFIVDEEQVQTTVIGRTVNLAGRMSSATRRPGEDELIEVWEPGRTVEPAPGAAASGGEFPVSVEPDGTLINEGIAISRDAVQQLEAHLPVVHSEREGGHALEYFDEQIGRRIVIRYAGDAKFKGVRSSFPVYSVDFEG